MYVKICGITRADIAVNCFEAGADMIGLVYYPPSPRHVEVEQLGQILDAVKNFRNRGGKVVLVVVNELPNEIDARFDYVQIHGKIREDSIDKINCGIIRVVKKHDEMKSLLNGNEAIPADQLFILEMSHGILPGGNGTKWNWSEAQPFCKRFRTLIAGGITPENAAKVFNETKPFGIDVSSGVELTAGIKDMTKVKKIIKIAKNIC
jgi:phosphoribosylanthranilate isomerase